MKNISNKASKKQITFEKNFNLNVDLTVLDNLLKNKKPHTYMISFLKNNHYLLSYVRIDDGVPVHVQFCKSNKNTWIYENLCSDEEISMKKIIEKIIHYEEGQPTPKPLDISNIEDNVFSNAN